MNKKQHFNQTGFDKFCNGLARAEQRFNKAVETLRNEGIDVSVKALSSYPELFPDFDSGNGVSYLRHFNKLYEDAVKRAGWLPNAEKARMHNNFMEVWEQTKDAAQAIADIMSRGYKFVDTGNGAVIDIKATEEATRPNYIEDYDADLMAEHLNLMREIRQKVDALNNFNLKHGLPRVSAPNAYDLGGFTMYMLGLANADGVVTELTEEKHDEFTWQCFRIKK